MELTGRSFYQFLPVFISDNKPDLKLTLPTVSTIMDLYEAYAIISLDKNRSETITEEAVIRQAGLSEPVFHTYFQDVEDMENSLKQMVLSHTQYNLEVFRSCFRGHLSLMEIIELIDMTRSFAPFVNALFRNMPDYEREYRDTFVNMLAVFSQDERLSPEIRGFLNEAVSTALISLSEMENGKSNNLTYYNTVSYIVKILQNISQYSIRISSSE